MGINNNVFYIISIVFLSACSTPSYLSTPANFKNQVKGLRIECDMNDGEDIKGEIIEIDAESITVLTDEEYRFVSKEMIGKAEIIVATTSDDSDKFVIWTVLLSLSSLGHGFFGVITLPLNLSVGGGVAADAKKGTYRIKFPQDIEWEQMSKFARFPQGIPPGFYSHRNY